MEDELARCLEILADVWKQFAIESRGRKHHGGLSVLEDVQEILEKHGKLSPQGNWYKTP